MLQVVWSIRWGNVLYKLDIYKFFFQFIFWHTERESRGGAEKERGRERESQGGSPLSAQSLMRGPNSQTVRLSSEPKSRVGCLTNWAPQAPLYKKSSLLIIFGDRKILGKHCQMLRLRNCLCRRHVYLQFLLCLLLQESKTEMQLLLSRYCNLSMIKLRCSRLAGEFS